jgi:cytidine deaminase
MHRLEGEINYGQWVAARGTIVDPWHSFLALAQGMTEAARYMADNVAISWRNFKVGAAVLAINPTEYKQGIFLGANFTPDPPAEDGTHAVKVCAEQVALQKAINSGYDRIIAITVSGQRQPDIRSGLLTPTLHPCGPCRDVSGALHQVADDALILSTATTPEGEDAYELHTSRELQIVHDQATPDLRRYRIDPNFTNWNARRPYYSWALDGLVGNAETPAEAVMLAVLGEDHKLST